MDYGEWKTGIQATGMLSSLNGFLGKVAQAVAGGISGLLLAWGAYDSTAVVQTTEALIAIKAMYLYIPMILLICSIVTMHFYKLDQQFPQIQKDLETKKKRGKMTMNEKVNKKQYMPLVVAAGIGSMLGSGIIIGLSATVTVWQSGLGLTDGQVGILSGALTFAIAAGSLLAGNITKALGLIRSF